MAEPIVYLIHRTTIRGLNDERRDKYDYDGAKKFGRLEYLFQDGEVRLSPPILQRELAERLKHFTDADFLICGGDPAVLFAAGIALYTNGSQWKSLRLLRWDKFKVDYRVYELQRNYFEAEG